MENWQSWAAPVVVVITAFIFLAKRLSKKDSGCGSACQCKAKPKLP